ncbi:transporter [Bacteroides sp. AM07-16]|nr:TolC family protein [Parabacteroides bouchesdurhonensis]RHJ90445.1 transporter [Bacteroides sp. AM07-16]
MFCTCYSYGQKKKKSSFDRSAIVSVSASNNDSIQAMLNDYERVQLPPLSVFLQSVYDHPSIRIYEARRDEADAELKITKREWLNYFRIFGQYQYGRVTYLSTTSTTNDPIYESSIGRNQHMYNAGISLSIPLGDLFGQKQKTRAKRARLRQLDYEYDISIEERKLRILEAYNQVLQALATLKAKSDAAALYNAQMKISEQDFINGRIDIIALSLERGRRSSANISYQEGRATLHNAVTLLEMLTNIKIINR